MKILILAQLVTHSGVGIYIKSLSEQLCKTGDEVHILSQQFDVELDDRIIKHRLCVLSKRNIPKNYRIFKKVVKDNKIDIIFVQHRIVGIYPLIYNLFGRKVPGVYILHTERLGNNSFINRLFTYKGDLTIAISTRVKESLIRDLKVDPEKIRLINNGVNNKDLKPCSADEKSAKRERLNIPGNKIVICVHGRIDYVKGHDLLFAAMKNLEATQLAKCHIVVSGSTENNPYYEQLQRQIEELQIKDLVTFVGWSSPEAVLSISDLMVQPSRREGFPLSTLEAFFMKVPVIRSLTGGAEDMRDCCRFVEIDNVEQLSNEINRYITARDTDKINEYKEMVDRAYEYANENGSIEIMTKRTRSVFEEILNENKKS